MARRGDETVEQGVHGRLASGELGSRVLSAGDQERCLVDRCDDHVSEKIDVARWHAPGGAELLQAFSNPSEDSCSSSSRHRVQPTTAGASSKAIRWIVGSRAKLNQVTQAARKPSPSRASVRVALPLRARRSYSAPAVAGHCRRVHTSGHGRVADPDRGLHAGRERLDDGPARRVAGRGDLRADARGSTRHAS